MMRRVSCLSNQLRPAAKRSRPELPVLASSASRCAEGTSKPTSPRPPPPPPPPRPPPPPPASECSLSLPGDPPNFFFSLGFSVLGLPNAPFFSGIATAPRPSGQVHKVDLAEEALERILRWRVLSEAGSPIYFRGFFCYHTTRLVTITPWPLGVPGSGERIFMKVRTARWDAMRWWGRR